MDYDIKVSVIIPTYKRAEDISRAVESVLGQTIDSFECIVVDDNGVGTPEGEATAAVMAKYANDARVKYIRHDVNKNGAVARNTGIKAASGKYISFLDDDDVYTPQRLGKMYDKMESLDESWGACYTGYVKHQASGKDQFSDEKQEGDLFVKALMRSLYIGSGSNLFFSHAAVEKTGLFNETFKRNQDLEYLIRVLQNYKMAYVDDVLMEVFYDIRTVHYTFEQSEEREINFRNNFQSYQQGLTDKQKRAIQIMYDLDWMRACVGYRKTGELIKLIFKAKVPIYIYWRYAKYVYDRWKRSVSYGFDVVLK